MKASTLYPLYIHFTDFFIRGALCGGRLHFIWEQIPTLSYINLFIFSENIHSYLNVFFQNGLYRLEQGPFAKFCLVVNHTLHYARDND